ncbi:MAG: MarR family transcriptional regulator [Chloroflexota bacterium]|nr:MAG: MarR family transcriptional regulator [Chloroflexota bacterium]
MREELVQQVIELRRRTNWEMVNRSFDSWANLALTLPQLKSLFYVSQQGRVNISGLASGIKVTPANVTGIVDRLVEQSLLTRTPDSDDRRVQWLTVTGKGNALVDDLRGGNTQESRKILDQLSEQELSEVAHGLRLLLKAFEATE